MEPEGRWVAQTSRFSKSTVFLKPPRDPPQSFQKQETLRCQLVAVIPA